MSDPIIADRILVGQSYALTGPSSAMGIGMQLGLQTSFNKINAEGGVHDRRIELISLDDVKGRQDGSGAIHQPGRMGSYNLGGVTLNYGANANQGMDKVFLVEFKGGKIEPIF